MAIGDTLINTLVTLEGGDKAGASVDFKIKSTDFRRFLKNLGMKTENMASEFEAVGQRIQEIFIQHFDSNQGPDENGKIKGWPAYSQRAPKGSNWIDRKDRVKDEKGRTNQGGDKLLHFSGDLRNSLEKGSSGNIHVVTKTRIEIGTDIPYAKYHERGFDAKNQYGTYDTTDETKRPIFGLTDEESNELAYDIFEEQFFKDINK